MTRPFLIIDNTRAVDPTVPDELYAGIAGNDHGDIPAGVAIAIAVGELLGRLGGIAFWIAVGVVGAMVL